MEMMKRVILTIITVIATVMIAFAGGTLTKTQARIYINPGHGSWGPNDRNLATINHATGDTTGFYESNTNLWKGLKMGAILEKWGVPKENIMYSRVKNGPYPYVAGAADAEKYNRNLTEISEECNAFNTDYFLSIHSDAATDGSSTNLSLLIYNGYTIPAADDENMWEGSRSLEYQQTSRAMAETLWPILESNGIDVLSSTSPRIVGDLTFYYGYQNPSQNAKNAAGYLGVLRRNTCNGFLAEGYCHTYQPARHRALNPDYCGQEGLRYARGVAAWFGWDTEETGYMMGSVKDLHTIFSHTYYHPNTASHDKYLPVNNAVVTLYKGGVEVAKYTTDDEYNGVFVFENLQPGSDYTLEVEAPGYKTLSELNEEYGREAVNYTVTAGETTYAIVQVETEGYVANPTYNYPDPLQDEWLELASSYEMRRDYMHKRVDVLADKTIRREFAKGDSVYVLALDAEQKPWIYCFDAVTQNKLFEVSTSGAGSQADENELLAISDIAMTSDSVLVACNQVKTTYSPTGVYRTYKWQRDEATRAPKGDPELWFESATNYTSGNFNNAVTGATMAVSGPLEDCIVVTTAQTTGASGEVRLPLFTISRKGLVGTIRNQDKSHFTTALLGDSYRLAASPLRDDAFVIDGTNTTPFEFVIGNDVAAPAYSGTLSTDVVKANAGACSFFKYAKHALVVVPATDGDGNHTGVALYDVTDGLSNARLVKTTNTNIDAVTSTRANTYAGVNSADISLYLSLEDEVSRFTTQDVEQAVEKRVFAYNLSAERADDVYTLTFEVNGDCAEGGKICFYDASNGENIGTVDVPAVTAGINSVEVPVADLPGDENTQIEWGVEVSGNNVWCISNLVPSEGDYALGRMYATVDCSEASPNMGKIYVSNFSGSGNAKNGVYVYSADTYQRENATPYGNSTFSKITTINIDPQGNAYVADSDAAKSGLQVAEAEAMGGGFAQYFEGSNASGIISNGGVEVAGVTSSVTFRGEGADTKMYAYMKNSAGKYVINVYNIGQADATIAKTWGVAPNNSIALPSGMLAEATVVAVEQGLWICQVVSSQSSDADTPTLIFVDYSGNVKLNLGLEENAHLLSGVSGGGMAVSADGATLVVNDENGLLQFYDVTWTDDISPVLTPRYSYSHGIGVAAVKIANGKGIKQMSFDPAGNLVAAGHYLGVFTIPTTHNSHLTKSKAIIGKTSGLNGVDADDETAPVEYYNLQGIKVANPQEGIFIRKQGKKAEKVLIK